MMRRFVSCLVMTLSPCQALPPDTLTSPQNRDVSFDYIVVGGGTAGATIATRLAEHKSSVALIEAGSYYEGVSLASLPIADVIGIGSDPTTRNAIDWGFVAKGQPGTNYRDIHFARGKCLGGSSALNFMVYQRPSTGSLQQWADAVGDPSYEFDQVLPFYKKSVQFQPENRSARFPNASVQYNSSAFDPNGGPLQVTYPNYGMPFSTWMQLGMDAIGIKEAADFNSGVLSGSQYCTSTIRHSDQSRSSSEASFLATKPGSLRIYTSTLVKKILFDNQKRAIGVEVTDALGLRTNITATKEVIVSAGAFQSPQLLMVSGIGPSSTLEHFGIPVLADIAGVGQNMWDHPFFALSYRVAVQTLTRVANDYGFLAEQFLQYQTSHTGVVTNPVADFVGWEKIPSDLRDNFPAGTSEDLSWFGEDWPEAEYISGAGYIGNVSDLFTTQPKDGAQYASILGVLVAPTSRGTVTILSSDTSDLPVINPNWLATETDQQMAVAIFRRIRAAFQSASMAPILIGDEYYPGPSVQSGEEILEFIKNNVMTLWHPAGTCRMGNSTDSLAVIDSHARVRGVTGLRVVDASSFPILPPGHPQSTVYMLAEKIADDITKASSRD